MLLSIKTDFYTGPSKCAPNREQPSEKVKVLELRTSVSYIRTLPPKQEITINELTKHQVTC